MELRFSGTVVEWRGPAPHHFVRLPPEEAAALDDVAPAVSYGWGMVPARVTLGATQWATALWPKDGSYLVPLKDQVRRGEGVGLGDVVTLTLHVAV